ncbi:rhomboid family intramembrane serine protease [Rhizobium sp. C4]|uniref:rhomboid family intramembrane serine protease n=1 Tax=Rhizobium sp. C4 TaxID=1349800 RepID=UPI001E442594|nr:rhomboid family intramembrane serine protease [Rhizobium sp. C4]MCD2175280.1 rhomboid family intramembrane serine protease [Rhizobium sp. C4]
MNHERDDAALNLPVETGTDETWPRQPGPPEREPLFNIPPAIVFIVAVTVLVEVLVSWVLGDNAVTALYYYGGFIPARYAGSLSAEVLPALTSPVTYAFLHGGWEHLVFNDIWLAIFGTPVVLRIGAFRFAIFWVLTSVAAAFAFDIANLGVETLLVGASGAISGLTGAACRFVWSGSGGMRDPALSAIQRRLSIVETLKSREVLLFIAFWLIANVVLAGLGVGVPGQAQAIAWQAHLGGFLAGFLLFPLFDPVGRAAA